MGLDVMRASSPRQPPHCLSTSRFQCLLLAVSTTSSSFPMNSYHLFNHPSLSLLSTIFSPYSASIGICTATPDPVAQSPDSRACQYARHTNVFGRGPTRLQSLCFRGVNLLVSALYLRAFLKPHFEKDPLGGGALPLSASLSQFRVVSSLLFTCS